MVNGLDPLPPVVEPKETKKERQARRCVEQGGTWDPNGSGGLGLCTFPDSGSKTKKEGLETPKGTFLGLSKPDAELLRQQQGTDQVAPLGTEAGLSREKIEQAQELLNKLPRGQEEVVAPTPPEAQANINPDTGLPFATPQEEALFNLQNPLQAITGQFKDPKGLIGDALLATPLGRLGFGVKAAGKAPSLVKAGQGVLKSPSIARKITKGLKERLLSGVALGAAVLTGAALKSFTGADIASIELEVTKYGEQLTKIPEAAKQGLSLENGKLVQYPIETALQDVADIIDTLDTYEEELQRQGIGNTILRLTGRYDAAQLEIEKQQREAELTFGKLITEQLTPTQSRLDAEEVFKLIELEGLIPE